MLDPVEEVRAHPLDRTDHLDAVVAMHELLEQHLDLQPGERRAEAEVRPAAAERYRAMLATNPRLRGAILSERTMFDRPITLLNLARRDLLQRRIKRKLGFYPKKL